MDDWRPIRHCASKLPDRHRRHQSHLACGRLRCYWRPSSVDGDLLRSRGNSFAYADTIGATIAYADTDAIGATIAYANRNTVGNPHAYAIDDAATDCHAQSDAAAAPDTVPAPHAVIVRPIVAVHSDR